MSATDEKAAPSVEEVRGLVERLTACRDRYTMACPDKPDTPFAVLTEAAQALTALLEEVGRLETESADLTKAITGLTCGGSEFFVRRGKRYVADIDACVEYVERTKRDAHKRSLDATKSRNDAEAARETAERKAAAMEEALMETWRVLRAAGTLNLTRGVQLGQTSWYVKICDAEALSEAALTQAQAEPGENHNG